MDMLRRLISRRIIIINWAWHRVNTLIETNVTSVLLLLAGEALTKQEYDNDNKQFCKHECKLFSVFHECILRLVWLSEVLVADKPFYQRWWFLVIIALVGVIIILVVVGVLYVTGKKRRRSAKSLS